LQKTAEALVTHSDQIKSNLQHVNKLSGVRVPDFEWEVIDSGDYKLVIHAPAYHRHSILQHVILVVSVHSTNTAITQPTSTELFNFSSSLKFGFRHSCQFLSQF